MIEALAAIGGGTALVALVAIIWLTHKTLSAKDEQLAARDMLDKEREEHSKTRHDLELETAAHKVTREELVKERDLRGTAESQRNQAFQQARDQLVERIKQSNIADAQRLVADLLAAPLPGVPPQEPAAGAAASDRDGLANPFL